MLQTANAFYPATMLRPHNLANPLPFTHTHVHAHSHTHSLSLTHKHTLSPSLSLSLFLTLSPSADGARLLSSDDAPTAQPERDALRYLIDPGA